VEPCLPSIDSPTVPGPAHIDPGVPMRQVGPCRLTPDPSLGEALSRRETQQWSLRFSISRGCDRDRR
jgi:hypothetical protein